MRLFIFVHQGNDSVEAIVQFMLDEQDKLLKTKADTKADKTLKPKEEVPSTSGKLFSAWLIMPKSLKPSDLKILATTNLNYVYR